jgi:predicted transglutaminase-like cysteine proteinase
MYQGYWLPIKIYLGISKFFASLLLVGLLFLPQSSVFADKISSTTVNLLDKEKKNYISASNRRFKAWKNLILTNQKKSLQEKLKATNDFFNQFIYEHEDKYQSATDYWKTPEEFIVDGAGDCEDFSIAKYFTLLALGVPVRSLRITYVKSIQLNRAHMVLAFYPSPEAEPVVLDNLMAEILPSSKRPDLIPVYSFNGEGLWLAKQRGRDKSLGDSSRLSKWQSVIHRMQGR